MGPGVFEVSLLRAAREDLARLDGVVARRVREKLVWLGENCRDIRHLALSRELAGLYKRRVGDYRIIYGLLTDERVLLVHRIGHRREIYEGA